jgi:hypothetical protein
MYKKVQVCVHLNVKSISLYQTAESTRRAVLGGGLGGGGAREGHVF